MNQIELNAVWTMKNYALMIIEISAGTTMYRWMEYDILTVTMIIYDQKYACINYPAQPNDVLMMIWISAGTTMMSVLLLWWFMISLVSILWSRNELKDTDIVNIDTFIHWIPYYFYWYLLTIIEQYTIMIHNQIRIKLLLVSA